MFNTSVLHFILSLLDSSKLQKAHCQPYRTLTHLHLSKHFAGMIFTAAGYCRHTITPCFTIGKLSHGETRWLGQKSLRENSGKAKGKPDGLRFVSVMNQLIIFSFSLSFYKDTLNMLNYVLTILKHDFFFTKFLYILFVPSAEILKLQFNLAFVVLHWNREDLVKLILFPIRSEEWILLYSATININNITWKCKRLHIYVFSVNQCSSKDYLL